MPPKIAFQNEAVDVTAQSPRNSNDMFRPPAASIGLFRRTVMPTIQKPQLNHVSFPWHEQSDRFHEELDSQSAEILERSGFNREFSNPDDVPNINAETEGTAFILELSGILAQ